MNYELFYPTPLDEIEDIYNDNIDVCVTVNRKNYTFPIVTTLNLQQPQFINKKGFVSPQAPFLIVEKLTDDVILALIEEFANKQKIARDFWQRYRGIIPKAPFIRRGAVAIINPPNTL